MGARRAGCCAAAQREARGGGREAGREARRRDPHDKLPLLTSSQQARDGGLLCDDVHFRARACGGLREESAVRRGGAGVLRVELSDRLSSNHLARLRGDALLRDERRDLGVINEVLARVRADVDAFAMRIVKDVRGSKSNCEQDSRKM